MSDHIVKAKLLALPSQCAALAGPQDVAPFALIHQGLKIHTTEFTVAEQHDPSPLGNQLPHLVHQLDVHSLRQVALSSLGYSPHDGQASLLIDQADHERHAATANDASVDYQHQWDVAQTQEQRSSKREEEGLALHRFIAKPSFESFDTSLDFRCLTSWPSRNLAAMSGRFDLLLTTIPLTSPAECSDDWPDVLSVQRGTTSSRNCGWLQTFFVVTNIRLHLVQFSVCWRF